MGEGGTRPPFYVVPQFYRVRYEATVKNESAKEISAYIILPIPRSTDYQIIQRVPSFFPEHATVGEDSKFGNRYAYWRTELAPNESRVFREEFTVTVSPRKAIIDKSITLDDYHVTRPGLITWRNTYVDSGDERVERIVQEVVGEERRISEIVMRLNEYVITRLVYGNPIEGLYSSKDALLRKKVDCGGFCTLLAALCIASGIPARVISGFWVGYQKNDMHAWLEIVLPGGELVPLDPSIDYLRKEGRTKKEGGFGFLGSDRIALSLGCEIPIETGDKKIMVDILQNPIVILERVADSFSVTAEFLTM